MQICEVCQTDGHYKLRCEQSVWMCFNCISKREDVVYQGVTLKNKIRVGSQWATEKQLKEMERRVILPYDKPGGGYYLGRRGENGKVQERPPDYRP